MTETIYVPDPLHQLVCVQAAAEGRSATQFMVDLIRHAAITRAGSSCQTVIEALRDGPLDADAIVDRTPLGPSAVFLALQVLTAQHGERRALVTTTPLKTGRLEYRLADAK